MKLQCRRRTKRRRSHAKILPSCVGLLGLTLRHCFCLAWILQTDPIKSLAVFGAYFLTFLARDGPLEWVRPIPNAPERSWHASGPIFSPNGRFWTHFGPFLMFLARLENQVWPKLGPEPSTRGPKTPTRPGGSGTFFWAPFRIFFLSVFRRISRKCEK